MITPPYELFDLPAEGELVTRVTAWEEGRATIKPARAPQGVEVDIIRLHVPAEDKPTEPRYWDVTATRLHPSLRTQLPAVVAGKRWLKLHKYGVAPHARFSLEVSPSGEGGPAFYGLRV